jgi:putative aldouronate transport system substrate-binding protein
MNKKWLYGCMAALTLTTVIGCGTDNEAGSSGSAETAKSNDPVKLSVLINGNGVPSAEKDFILQQWKKDLNMDIDLSVMEAEYDTQLNVKMAGGTPPDIFEVNGVINMTNFANQGLLLELDKYLDKMPNVKKLFTENDLNKGKLNGKLVTIPARSYAPSNLLFVREDWLQKLGLKIPTTIDEVKQVAIAFTNNDPDGNGKKDTYGLTSNATLTSFDFVFSAFGTARPGEYLINDGKLQYSTTMPQMQQALKFLSELQSAGALDPEILANKAIQHREKAYKGQVGMIYAHWAEMYKDEFIEQIRAVNPNAKWVAIETITGPGGTYMGTFDATNTPTRTGFSKSLEKNPDKLNKALELIDYVTDGKGADLVLYGIEGTHYKRDNGKIVPLPAINETNYAFNHQFTGRDDLAYLKVKFDKLVPYVEMATRVPRIQTYTSIVPVPQGVNAGDKKTFETEEIVKFIYGKYPNSDFPKFVDTITKNYNIPLYLETAGNVLKSTGFIK